MQDGTSDTDVSSSDSEGEAKLTSSLYVITASCCENMVDVSTQTVKTMKPVTCRCDEYYRD